MDTSFDTNFPQDYPMNPDALCLGVDPGREGSDTAVETTIERGVIKEVKFYDGQGNEWKPGSEKAAMLYQSPFTSKFRRLKLKPKRGGRRG